MANEKVSQMVSLTAGEVASNDLFMIVDSSARESKKISVSDVITYFEATGSFSAHATLADTASYIQGANVAGVVNSASNAQSVASASHALNADNAITASFALSGGTSGTNGTTLFTGSTYQITASAARSASYAVSSTFASSSIVAQNLQYLGVPNGTASFAISASSAVISITSSITTHAISASLADTATTALIAVSASNVIGGANLVRAYSWVTWSGITGKFNTTANTLYQAYNISSFEYDSSFTTGSDTTDFFIVQFINPMSSTNYAYMGVASGFIAGAYTAQTVMLPYRDRFTTGFTASVNVPTAQQTIFYASASLTFQVIGFP